MTCIAFRLDASADIGLGHLMRCLAIADFLAERGAVCHFLTWQLPAAQAARLFPHQHHPLPDKESLGPLAALQPRWLVIDHYHLDRRWEQLAAEHCRHILVIDDLADRPHHCQLLLDQGPLRSAHDYADLIPTDGQLLLGTDYALLRPAFRAKAKTSLAPWQKGLICFGGADPAGACLTTLQSLAASGWAARLQWTVVAGSANPQLPALQTWLAAHSSLAITLLAHSNNMAELMAGHDMAIGAAGGMTWERACIGLPTLAVAIVDNQVFNAEVIAHYQLAASLSLTELTQPATLAAALTELEEKQDNYRLRAQAMVDGRGLSRLACLLLAGDKHGLQPVGNRWRWQGESGQSVTLSPQAEHWLVQGEPLAPSEWQELAHALLYFIPDSAFLLVTDSAWSLPAPWQRDEQGWRLTRPS